MIDFIVPAIPIAQPRQRHRLVTSGGKTFASNYTPARDPVNAFKAACQLAAAQAYQGPPLDDCDISLRLVFVMPRRSNMLWKTKPMPRVCYRVKKNDWDNLGKSVCDALNGLVWTDDGLIHSTHIERWYASGEEQPHCEIEITKLPV